MMKNFFLLLALCPLTIVAQGDRFQCDDSCDPNSSGVATFNVVSPVGFSTEGYPALADCLLSPASGGNDDSAVRSAKAASSVGKPVRTDYYNMQGHPANRLRRGVVIRRNIYRDRSAQSRKQIYR